MHIQESSSLVDSYLSRTYLVRDGIVTWKELLKNQPQEHTSRLLCIYVYQHSLLTKYRPASVLILIYGYNCIILYLLVDLCKIVVRVRFPAVHTVHLQDYTGTTVVHAEPTNIHGQ